MKDRYHRIDAVIRFNGPDEYELHDDIERLLEEFFDVVDLSIYEVVHCPSFAEQAREKVQQAWKNRLSSQ